MSIIILFSRHNILRKNGVEVEWSGLVLPPNWPEEALVNIFNFDIIDSSLSFLSECNCDKIE